MGKKEPLFWIMEAMYIKLDWLVCYTCLKMQDVVAACEIVNCNGVEVQCQVFIFPHKTFKDVMTSYWTNDDVIVPDIMLVRHSE